MTLHNSLKVIQKQGSCSKQEVETTMSIEPVSNGNCSYGFTIISTLGCLSKSTEIYFIFNFSKNERREPLISNPPRSRTIKLSLPYISPKYCPVIKAVSCIY